MKNMIRFLFFALLAGIIGSQILALRRLSSISTSVDLAETKQAMNVRNLESRLHIMRIEAGTLASALEKIIVSSGEKVNPCDIMVTTLPIIIKEPGIYCLSNNFNLQNSLLDAITINADNVIIDGMGHTIHGPSSPDVTTRGVYSVDHQGITIRNTRIIGFNTSILIGSTDQTIPETRVYSNTRKSKDILVTDLRINNATFMGIYVMADNVSITGNSVSGVGPSTVNPDSFATGINVGGNGCDVSGNRVLLGDATGTGENIGIAVYFGEGCRIERNTVFFDKFSEFGRNYGIWTKPDAGGLPYVASNLVSGAHYAFGPHGMFEGNVGANIVCHLFARRDNPPNLFVEIGKNTLENTGGNVRPGDQQCYDTAGQAIKRFDSHPSANAAYSVALTLAETDPLNTMSQTLAWVFVAAKLGHAHSKVVQSDPAKFGYSQKDIETATGLAKTLETQIASDLSQGNTSSLKQKLQPADPSQPNQSNGHH